MALTLIVTDAGRAALVNASNSGTAPVTIAQVGVSGSAVTPSRTATSLPGEIKRIVALSGDVVAADTIHMMVRDESNAVYTLRSFALYLSDGTLFAIYGQPDIILEKSSQALMLLAIDVQFADVSATQLTFGDANFLNPPATTERVGVVELATVAEARAGVDALRALTPAGAKAAILSWLLAQDGAGSGLDADLLDGRDGSYYASVADRLGYTPANRAGDTFTGDIRRDGQFYLGLQNGNPILNFDDNDYFQYDRGNNGLRLLIGSQERFAARLNGDFSISGSGNFTFNGATVWHAGNDGAGSGLDADLLDGIQAGSFARTDVASGASFAGGITAPQLRVNGGASVDALVVTTGDVHISRTNTPWGYIIRPNVPGYRNLQFATVGGGALDNIELNGHNVTILGQRIWTAGNDGAGSGLDADVVDGLHAHDFFKAWTGQWLTDTSGTARFHFTAGGDTHARVNGAFRWQNRGDANVGHIDEAGNLYLVGHVDADRIALRANGTGQAIRVGDDAFIGDINRANAIGVRGVGDSRAGYVVFGDSPYSLGCNPSDGTLRYDGNPLWHTANDGAGSGLDADLLDGYQADAFDRVIEQNLSPTGFKRYASGLKECWGSIMVGGTTSVTVQLPTAHSSWFVVTLGAGVKFTANAQDNTAVRSKNGVTSFTIQNWEDTPVSVDWATRGV